MANFQPVYGRILKALNIRTQVELAEILEVRQSTISDAKRRDSIPPDWYMKLMVKFGLSPDWLRQGTLPVFLRADGSGETPDHLAEPAALFADPLAQAALVSVYGMAFDYAGDTPLTLADLPVEGKLSLPRPFAEAVVFCLRSAGFPSLRKGAYIGVDPAAVRPIAGELFAVAVPHEGLVVRRLFSDPDQGRFVLRVDAPGYPEIQLAEEGNTRLFGRVVWALQSF